MEWMFGQWCAFADWSAGQPVLCQIAIGSLILSMAYLIFVLVLNRIGSWAGDPTFLPPAHPTDPSATRKRGL